MYIEIDLVGQTSRVCDVDDLTSFSVQTGQPADTASLDRALGSLGRMESDEHAWIDIDALRIACPRAGDPEWSGQFEAMVAYAKSRGWLDDAGTALRAHVERHDGVSPA